MDEPEIRIVKLKDLRPGPIQHKDRYDPPTNFENA
jgi:hypothetical protein